MEFCIIQYSPTNMWCVQTINRNSLSLFICSMLQLLFANICYHFKDVTPLQITNIRYSLTNMFYRAHIAITMWSK